LLSFPVCRAQKRDTTLAKYLAMDIEELMNTEVSIATKSNESIRKTPAIVSVITEEEIKNMGARELIDVLNTLPGFESGQLRLGTKNIGIRGVTDIRQGGRLLILLDGTPYNDIMYGSGTFYGYEYNIDAIKRIEVIRGPGSALYGTNAFSGVINIITKSGEEKNGIEFGAKYGSYNSYAGYVNASGTKNGLKSFLSISGLKTDGTDVKIDNGNGGESLYGISHQNIYSNIKLQYKDIQFSASLIKSKDGGVPGIFATNSYVNMLLGAYNLMYTKKINEKINFSTKLYGRNEHRIEDIELLKPNTTAILAINPITGDTIRYKDYYTKGIYAYVQFNEYKYGVDAEFNFDLFSNNYLLLGVQAELKGVRNATVDANYNLVTYAPLYDSISKENYSKDNMPRYQPGWIYQGGHSYSNYAIYLQDRFFPVKNLAITLGGRLDFDSENGISFNPRIGLVYGVLKNINLKLLYSRAYSVPSTNQNYKFVGFDIGNNSLKEEVINTYELAISHQIDKMFNQISVYYNKLENLIYQDHLIKNQNELFIKYYPEYVNDTSVNFMSYYNGESNTSYGLEYENKILFSKRIYTCFNYSFSHSIDTKIVGDSTMNSKHPNVSCHLINLGFNYYITKNILFNINLRYQGELSKYMVRDNNGVEIPLSQQKFGDMLLLNSTLRLINLIPDCEMSVSAYNILNQTYYYQDNQYPIQPKQNGLNFIIRASYKF